MAQVQVRVECIRQKYIFNQHGAESVHTPEHIPLRRIFTKKV